MASSDSHLEAQLISVANALCRPGYGILASDESPGTIGKRLEKNGIENNAENRRQYRELFYTANIGGSIAGCIMHPETLLQSASDGTSFVQCLADRGILAGVKVDEGLELMGAAGNEGETTTRGMETLAQRCQEYVKQGASFAKWRAALKVPPSEAAIAANAEQLAQYAVVCQQAGLVPIVEPEILIDGDHTIEEFEVASTKVISACISALWRHGVVLEATLLKPQMIVPGADSNPDNPKPSSEEIAERTLRVMRRCVPAAIPGIMFLSGGQSEVEATANLNTINIKALEDAKKAPWALSFSYGRALQASVLKLWSQEQSEASRQKCREMAAGLARVQGLATLGQWSSGDHPSITSEDGALSLREGFRGWMNPAS